MRKRRVYGTRHTADIGTAIWWTCERTSEGPPCILLISLDSYGSSWKIFHSRSLSIRKAGQ